jgi:hypothetical protein
MTARKPNMILKSLLQQEADSNRSSLPHTPSQIVEKPRKADDAWCIVSTDGSTSIIACKSAYRPLTSSAHDQPQPSAEQRASEAENRNEDLTDEPEPGVDLSCLIVEKDTTSKLIAGMNAMTEDGSATLLRREIAMPSARTDLKEIFKTDSVCMVSLPKSISKGSGIEDSGFRGTADYKS